MEFKEEDLTDEEDRGSSGEYGDDGEGYAKSSDSATLEVALEGYFEDQIFDPRELSLEAQHVTIRVVVHMHWLGRDSLVIEGF